MDNAVKLIEMGEDTAIVGGYGVVFGGEDLEGETFTKDTNFMLDLVPQKPVLYHHGQNSAIKKSFIGSVSKAAPDDVGVWVEAELELSKEYVSAVLDLVKLGRLGWSSGSISHLAERDGGIIKAWPIVEFSLTPTPAEPRTLGVERLKALAELDPTFADIARAAQDSGAVEQEEATEEPTEKIVTITKSERGVIVEKQEEVKDVKTVIEEAPEFNADELRNELKAVRQRVETLEKTPVNDSGVQVPAVLKNGRGDDPTKAILSFIRYGDVGALRSTYTKAANDTIGNATTGADGEYAVPDVQLGEIIAKRDESLLRTKLGCRMLPAGPGKTMLIPYDNEDDVEFYAGTEQIDDYSNVFTRNFPAIGQHSVALARRDMAIPLSIELIEWEDAQLMAFINDYIARSWAKDQNSLLVAAVKAGGTANALDSATVVGVTEPAELMWNLPDGYEDNTAWLMKKSTAFELYTQQATSAAGEFLFSPTPAGVGNPTAPNLLFSPVYFSGDMGLTAASATSLAYGNFNFVGYRDSGLRFQRNPYKYQGIVFLEYHYWAAYKVLQAEAIQLGVHPSA